MRDELIKLIGKAVKEWLEKSPNYEIRLSVEEYVADHLISNGAIVPPCKVGDKVYITDGIPNEVTECEITSFTVDCDGVGGFSYEPLDKLKAGFASCDCLIAEWGDTVFLTKEEAERKLEELGV